MLQILEQINKALVCLVGRVDGLEGKKATEKVESTHPIRVNAPVNKHHLLLPRSNNDDFVDVSKSIYKMVQIRHHESNWKTLPKSIQDRLNKLIEDIKPPMGDDVFKTELKLLTQQYSEEVRRLVSDHLTRKRVETEFMAGELDPTDVSHAKEVAAKYLTARLGKRLSIQRRTELMNDRPQRNRS